jgi:hypothetical protein
MMRMLARAGYRTPEGDLAYEWMPVSAVMKYARECTAFCSTDERGLLRKLRNLRDAVHVTLKRLAEWGLIEIERREGRRGRTLWTRKMSIMQLLVPGKRPA